MPLKVCPNCVYYRLDNSLCISGLNLFSRKIAREGNIGDFGKRAIGTFCPNNLYLASLALPVVGIIPALFLNFSFILLGGSSACTTGLPHRQDRRQAGRRLHPRRAQERHHRRRNAGLLRAIDRLRRDQGAAFRLREVPGRQRPPDHADEVGGRGDGHGPHLPGVAAEGPARAGSQRLRPRRDRGRARGNRPRTGQPRRRSASGISARPSVPASPSTKSSSSPRSIRGSWCRSRSWSTSRARFPAAPSTASTPTNCGSSSARASPTAASPT